MSEKLKEKELVGKRDLKDALTATFEGLGEGIADSLMENLLEDDRIVKFVSENCEPTEVYEESVLFAFIHARYSPEDVFRQEDLEEWAKEAGYTKLEETDEDE